MTSDEKLVTLGKIGKTHGIKGWLRLHSFTDPASNLTDYRHFTAFGREWREQLEMDEWQSQGAFLIAHFSGYDDPDSAQRLVGAELRVAVSELSVLENGEYYWYQLIGLTVINTQGERYGTVARMLETGANDVLVVSPDGQSIDDRERLIPYLPDTVVKRVDLGEGLLVVDWGADYLS